MDAERCKFGLEALRQYRSEYDEKKKVFKDTPLHNWTSHFADSARYMCIAWRELVVTPPKPKLKKFEVRIPTLQEMLENHDRYIAVNRRI